MEVEVREKVFSENLDFRNEAKSVKLKKQEEELGLMRVCVTPSIHSSHSSTPRDK